MTARQPSTAARPFRLSLRSTAILLGLLGLAVVVATDQILPASSDRQAELRFWVAARATGIVAFLLLTFQVVFGLVLSHPHNKSTWKLSKRLFPWHDHLWVFVMAFLIAHVVSLAADPKSGVDALGAVVPGLSQYRSAPVALGTLALYAFFVTAITARYTKLLPAGAWLALHRLAALIYVFSWMHGILSGTEFDPARRPLCRGRADRDRCRGLSLLGRPACPTDVRYLVTGGSLTMSDTRSLRLRRLATVVGVILVMAVGVTSIQAAATWTAASAPLTVAPVSMETLKARLADEEARSAALQAQLDELDQHSRGLVDALAQAQTRVTANSGDAETIRAQMAASTKRLARLDAAIATAEKTLAATIAKAKREAAAAAAAANRAATGGGSSSAGGEHDDDHGDDGD